MSDAAGSLIRRAVLAACLTFVVAARSAAQQPLPNPPAVPEFLSRSDFQVMLAGLSYDDDRFSWDGHLRVDVDLVDYVAGRVSLLADYQAVMGNQFQPFDPNQGNYTLAAAISARARGTEFAAVFHHVSRHLSDRAKDRGIAMNILDARVLRQVPLGTATLDLRADIGKVIQNSYIDYTWIGRLELVGRHSVSPRLGVFGRVVGETYGVDRTVARRGQQNGGRLEGGIRVAGQSAALELFAGYERVVDADPFDRLPRQWAFAGFRLLRR
jgi:hypothetical protein